MRHLFLACFLAAAAGCYAHHDDDFVGPATATSAAPLTVSPVTWNPSNIDVGAVQSVVEQPAGVLVFSDRGVLSLSTNALLTSDASVTTWRSAAQIAAPDGVTTWTVGIDGDGHLQRIFDDEPPADVTDRYGLAADAKVQALASGTARVGFVLDGSVAVADGTNVTSYPLTAKSVAANGTRVAVADGLAVRVFDGGKETDISFADAQLVAFDAAGTLYAASTHALYEVDGTTATELFDTGSRSIHQLAGSATGVWLAVDGDLARYDGTTTALGSGGSLAPDARLIASASGDVWSISEGALARWSTGGGSGPSADETSWNTNVAPVNTAVCGNCHGPPGGGKDSAHVDLSTYAQWVTLKSAIYTRVVTDKTGPGAMPPTGSGTTLTDAQRSAIEAWSKP